MAWKLLPFILLSVLGVANASTQANENDFENHPSTKRVPVCSFSGAFGGIGGYALIGIPCR